MTFQKAEKGQTHFDLWLYEEDCFPFYHPLYFSPDFFILFSNTTYTSPYNDDERGSTKCSAITIAHGLSSSFSYSHAAAMATVSLAATMAAVVAVTAAARMTATEAAVAKLKTKGARVITRALSFN